MNPAVRQLLFSAPFTPARLFRAGEQGAWFDPSDLSTLFQDSAGTTPVTAVGQPVGKILDKSGRGNHATQATAASRPVLQQDASGYYYLAFDGTDDGMATAAIDFTATDKMTVWAGVYKASDAAAGAAIELSANSGSNAGTFALLAPGSAAANYSWRSAGTTQGATTPSGFAAPEGVVISAIGDVSGDATTLRRNGAQIGSAATDQGTGTYGNYVLYLGRRGGTTLPFNGRIYGLIVRGASTDATTLSRAERHVGQKMGIAL